MKILILRTLCLLIGVVLLKAHANPLIVNNEAMLNTGHRIAVSCGDVLEIYAEKPKDLDFIKCEYKDSSQIILEAEYRVFGNKSERVEAFLVQQYGLGRLEKDCCGWSSKGYGSFTSKQLVNMNPDYTVAISMFGSGEVLDTKSQSKTTCETDSNKIAFFSVIVQILEV